MTHNHMQRNPGEASKDSFVKTPWQFCNQKHPSKRSFETWIENINLEKSEYCKKLTKRNEKISIIHTLQQHNQHDIGKQEP